MNDRFRELNEYERAIVQRALWEYRVKIENEMDDNELAETARKLYLEIYNSK